MVLQHKIDTIFDLLFIILGQFSLIINADALTLITIFFK